MKPLTRARALAVRRGAALALITTGAAGLWGWSVAALVLGTLLLVPGSVRLDLLRRAPGGDA